MNRWCTSLIGVVLLVGVFSPQLAAKEPAPRCLKRSESFLGIHFDFHAGDDCTEIGQKVDREMIEFIIDQVKPDYIQTDCKGHRGLTSYPTKVGNPAPGFVKDTLKLWREVTAAHGIALYMHYSGVWDAEAVKRHPDWARLNEKGQKDNRLTSVFGPYVDNLLIPQLKELADVYGIDGMWIDGECWATERDYAEPVLKAFREKTGIADVPRKKGDPHWFEFSEFCRQGFRDYLNHYVTEMHKHHPNFQIASNWAYSSMMPEPVTVPVDFISGDYSPRNSVNTARFEGRCMVHQGKPWDLMAWSFTRTDGLFTTKTVPQLRREAAMVLALGGGFQAYFPQRRDGSVRKWQMNLMREVAQFCRARQQICHRAKPIPQIGLIYSTHAYYRQANRVFAPWGGELTPLRGILQSLLDAQNIVDVVMEHHLENRMRDYPLLIYPEWSYIDPAFKGQLLEYVRGGGRLLLVGPRSAALFAKELNLQLKGSPAKRVAGLEYNGWVAGLNTLCQKVSLPAGAETIGRIHPDNDTESTSEPAASIHPYGKGLIGLTYLDLGERYHNAASTVARDLLNGLIRRLFPDPLVEIGGSHYVDVTAMRQGKKLTINLVNTAGPHSNDKVLIFDDIPAVGPLDITIRAENKPARVTLEPAGKPLAYRYQDGKVRLALPTLAIHDIIVLE